MLLPPNCICSVRVVAALRERKQVRQKWLENGERVLCAARRSREGHDDRFAARADDYPRKGRFGVYVPSIGMDGRFDSLIAAIKQRENRLGREIIGCGTGAASEEQH